MLNANTGRAAVSQFRLGHVILALAPVFFTFLAQWMAWPFIRPYAWFLFSPAVFLSAWIGGRRLGILATIVATLLVSYFFLPPERTFVFERPIGEIASALTFLGTGIIFSLFHDRLKRAERAIVEAQSAYRLRASEQRLRLALRAAGLGVFEWNIPTDRAVWENERMFELFGHASADGALSKETLIADYMHPDDVAVFEQALAEGMKAGRPVHATYRIRRKDGAMRWLDLSSSFELARDGSPLRMIGVLADITERQLSEEKLRASEEQFRILADTAPVLIWSAGTDRLCTFFNKPWLDFTGRSMEQELGNGWTTGVHPDDYDRCLEIYVTSFDARKPFEMEYRLRRYDGEYRWIVDHGVPRFSSNGAFLGYIGSCMDIHERKEIEESLRASELRFRAMVSALPSLTYEGDSEGNNTFVSEQWCAYTGMTAAETAGRGFVRTFHPDDEEESRARYRAAVQSGTLFESRLRIRAADGSYRWFLNRASPGRDSEGRLVRWAGSLTDIDDLVRAQEALRESRERLAGIVSTTMDAIITVDNDHSIVLFNQAAERMFGCSASAALGLPIERFIPERFRGMYPEHIGGAGETGRTSRTMGQVRELSGLRADGTEFPMEASISKIEVGGRKLFTVILRDITERKQAEAEREQLAREQTARAEAERAAERIRRLQAVIDSALVHLTLDDLFHEMLARIRELLETDSAAILLLTEDKRSLVMRAAIGFEEEAVGFRLPVGEGVAGSIAASLAPLIVEDLSTINVINPALRRNAHSLIGAPLILKGECIGVIHADTLQTRRFAESDLRLLQLAADRIALAIELRHLYEVQQQARHQAEEANRMKDEFLAVVSHELRSPLTAILGYTRMLRSGPADRETIDHATAVVERSAKAQLQIIEDLLDSARIITGKLRIDFEAVDLVTVLEAALDTVRATAESKGIALVAHFGWAPEETLGDSMRLQQVVWNLLSNAIKFTPKGGRVELRMKGAADHVVIEVSDSGKGIEPEFLPFIFDRFRQADSSSARRFGGLGLGLSLVKHLVELHGGTIAAESEGMGRGSTFTVTLPRRQLEFVGESNPAVAPREVRTNDALVADEAFSLAGVSVLLVDDQEEVRILLSQALEEYGAITTAVPSGAEALDFLFNPPDGRRPDVMILDIAMPGEDGYSVLKKVRALEAEQGFGTNPIPAIALTAFARSEDRLRALQAGFDMHVTKPVEPPELALTIASLTNRSIWDRRRREAS